MQSVGYSVVALARKHLAWPNILQDLGQCNFHSPIEASKGWNASNHIGVRVLHKLHCHGSTLAWATDAACSHATSATCIRQPRALGRAALPGAGSNAQLLANSMPLCWCARALAAPRMRPYTLVQSPLTCVCSCACITDKSHHSSVEGHASSPDAAWLRGDERRAHSC